MMFCRVIIKLRGGITFFQAGGEKFQMENFNHIDNKEFYPQTNGEISDSITQNWTEQAIECYQVCANCSKCSLSKGNYSFICQMPRVVRQLLTSCGKPGWTPIKTLT